MIYDIYQKYSKFTAGSINLFIHAFIGRKYAEYAAVQLISLNEHMKALAIAMKVVRSIQKSFTQLKYFFLSNYKMSLKESLCNLVLNVYKTVHLCSVRKIKILIIVTLIIS